MSAKTLVILALVFWGSQVAAMDASEACDSIKSDASLRSTCFDVIAGGQFHPDAVAACESMRAHADMVDCLRSVRNRYFSTEAVLWCDDTYYAQDKIDCFELVADAVFPGFDSCTALSGNSTIANCLEADRVEASGYRSGDCERDLALTSVQMCEGQPATAAGDESPASGGTCNPAVENCPEEPSSGSGTCNPAVENCPEEPSSGSGTCNPEVETCPGETSSPTCNPAVEDCSGQGNTCNPAVEECPGEEETCNPAVENCSGSAPAASCPMSVPSVQTLPFGTNGSKGGDGRNGDNGRSGEKQTVFADGSSQRIDLRGQNGADGENGQVGKAASGCQQPKVMNNLVGAPGGRGGNGGRGGSGGNGGTLTLYYNDWSDLKKLEISAAPGKGGRGGLGAPGGNGCECDFLTWSGTVCQAVSNGQGGYVDQYKDRSYACMGGDRGGNGQDGQGGSDGSYGTITLIEGTEALPAVNPTLSIPLNSLTDERYEVSDNTWERKSGARSLFSSGSDISDTYLLHTGQIRRFAQVRWLASRPASEFSQFSVSISIADGQARISLPEELWFKGSSEVEGDTTILTVEKVLSEDEVLAVDLEGLEGQGSDIRARLIDRSGLGAAVETSFQVLADGEDMGEVPANMITRNGDQYAIDLGRMAMADRSVAAGESFNLTVRMVRSFNGFEAKKDFTKSIAFTAFEMGELQGEGANLTLSLSDGDSASPLLSTSFRLRYAIVEKKNETAVFDNEVPASALSIQGRTVTIRLGQLGIAAEYLSKEALEAKGKVKITVTATRGFLSASSLQTLERFATEPKSGPCGAMQATGDAQGTAAFAALLLLGLCLRRRASN